MGLSLFSPSSWFRHQPCRAPLQTPEELRRLLLMAAAATGTQRLGGLRFFIGALLFKGFLGVRVPGLRGFDCLSHAGFTRSLVALPNIQTWSSEILGLNLAPCVGLPSLRTLRQSLRFPTLRRVASKPPPALALLVCKPYQMIYVLIILRNQ